MLKAKRPDIEIVGDEVTPLQKVNDFAPYHHQDPRLGGGCGHHRQLGQDINLLLKAAAKPGSRRASTPTMPGAPAARRWCARPGSPTGVRGLAGRRQ